MEKRREEREQKLVDADADDEAKVKGRANKEKKLLNARQVLEYPY